MVIGLVWTLLCGPVLASILICLLLYFVMPADQMRSAMAWFFVSGLRQRRLSLLYLVMVFTWNYLSPLLIYGLAEVH